MAVKHEGVNVGEIEEWFDEEDEEVAAPAHPVDPTEKYASIQLRVVRETKDYQLDYLQHALRPGHEVIDISPTYQRRLRWDNKKRSLLIESFLLNIPVPSIYLFEQDYNEYEVIDGRQRLDAIISFLSNGFALTALEYWPELNRKRFGDLPSVLQKGLLRRSLPAVVLLAETQNVIGEKLDVRRALFDRLNTGGIKLNPQELRNALHPGEFNAMLNRLARSRPFTDVWEIPPVVTDEDVEVPESLSRNPLYATLADAELVLRFFALRDAIVADKKGSLRSILDRYMASQVGVRGSEIELMADRFQSCIKRLAQSLGNDVFRLSKGSKRLSRPLYDALMIALSLEPELQIERNSQIIRAALDEALGDAQKYGTLVGRGNTISAVHDRVNLAQEILRAGSSEV